MAVYQFEEISGTTVPAFDLDLDTLVFGSSYEPAGLQLVASGSDTVVTYWGIRSVTLAGLIPTQLDGRQFVFAAGGIWGQGGSGDDSLEGTVGIDVFDLRAGGSDRVSAGDGDDVIDVGNALDANDLIMGGDGQSDVVRLAGTYESTVVLTNTTIRGVEQFLFGSGTVRLQLSNALLATATPYTYWPVLFDATSQTAADAVYLDGSRVVKPFEALMGAGDDTVLGGARGDTLEGGVGDNLIAGGAGNDRLKARPTGNSTLLGGAGNDVLSVTVGYSGSSGLVMAGGTGSDTLTGGEGQDELFAAGWEDAVGVKALDADSTLNELSGKGGNDILWGAAGRDTLLGGSGDDTLHGGAGHDSLEGGAGDDSLKGGDGGDMLDAGEGWDVLDGGAGDDGYRIRDGAQQIVETAGGGTDMAYVFTDEYTLPDHVEHGRLSYGWNDHGDRPGRLVGNAQDNVLTGREGNDTLEGGAGNDTLSGGRGRNRLEGGTGDDEYLLSSAADVVVEAAEGGVDTLILTSDEGYVLAAEVENATVEGYDGVLVGNAKDNVLSSVGSGLVIKGLDGNDTLKGGAHDVLRGGTGDDTYILVGLGAEVAVREAAGQGTDTLVINQSTTLADHIENLTLTGDASEGTGNEAANVIRGNAVANRLDGGAGADTLVGGGGNDWYYVADAGDAVVESSGGGIDRVMASVSHTLAANVENLSLYSSEVVGLRGTGNALNNRLVSEGIGGDTMDGGAGADTMEGGHGNDLYLVDNARDVVQDVGGIDTVRSTVNFVLGAGEEHLVLGGSRAISGTGNGLTNRLQGNALDNKLYGAAGHDTLHGGAGADTLEGGKGNDTYHVDSAGDLVVEADGLGSGVDLVVSTVSRVLGDFQEELVLSGTADLRGTGNALANKLTGNAGANRLDGRLGADTMAGGLGNDTYVVDHAGDRVTESAGAGVDTLRSSVTRELGLNEEHLILTGSAAVDGTGNMLANRLSGNSAANVLIGGAGADTMEGGKGNDTYHVDSAGDLVVEADGLGSGVDLVVSTVSRVLGDFQEELVLSGTADLRGTGNALANKLTGNAGANRLDGRLGADTMAGGLGNDTYVVDHAGDRVTESAGAGVDTLHSSVTRELGLNQEHLILTGSAAVDGTGNTLANRLSGNSAANVLIGGAGEDSLAGGAGNDTIVGGAGADRLRGGDGQDRFVFSFTKDSDLQQGTDRIEDFVSGIDRIDLASIDADASGTGNQAFRYVGTQAFQEGASAGLLRVQLRDGALFLEGSTDADAAAEIVIELAGVSSILRTDLFL